MQERNPRNLRPPLSHWRYWSAWILVVAGGATVYAICLGDLRAPRSGDASLFVVIGLLVMLELGPVVRGRWERPYTSTMASSLMFIFALLLHWGLAVAIVGHAIGLVLESILTRKAVWRTVVNVADYALTLGCSYLALMALGQHASLAHPGDIDAATLPALVAAGLVGFAVNSLIVGTLDALRFQTSWRREVTTGLRLAPLNDCAAIALSPLVVLAAQRSPWLVPLLLIPLFAVYRSNVVSLALKHQAGHDALTGLPNRTFLLERAHEVFAASALDRATIGLFVIDLDRFKEINDSLGHQVGDRLLQVIGDRLAGAVRPGDFVARLGGDEFAVLLPNVVDEVAARAVAARITSAMREPVALDGATLNVDGSLGIALSPPHGGDFETLLQRADLAMYSAKDRGTSYEIYSAEFDSGSSSRLNLLNDLRRALERQSEGELELHYQPQVNMKDGRVVGVEALLRWRHPVRGLVSPDGFIGKVEHTALMSSLTRWVIDDALHQAADWADVGLSIRVAVNVSIADLHREEFAEYVAFRLRHHQVGPSSLQLEITEGALMVDPSRVLATLHALESLGVSLSLDDFGTGYSSMSQLHRLPVEEIKIDRSFVSGMHNDVDDRTIVRSMIELGRALRLRVVAEGVENEATWTQLTEMGCDDAQGWHVCRALPVPEMTAWLQAKQDHRPPLIVLPDLKVDIDSGSGERLA